MTFLAHQRVPFVLRLRQSFPEDCARLKLSSARASQAGLKEMMMQTKNEGLAKQQDRGGQTAHPECLITNPRVFHSISHFPKTVHA